MFGLDYAALVALMQVIMIDLVLAGDNAIVIGMAAAGLPSALRRNAILIGILAATVLRIVFALATTWLMQLVGLILLGGVLLLWVCWKMYRDLRAGGHGAAGHAVAQPKTLGRAMIQIIIADVSMSLDNVLAVAGAAHEHPWIMVFGLVLSIALMGIAATFIARLLNKHRWIGYVGLVIVLYVAVHMIWDGYRSTTVRALQVSQHNATAPAFLDIDAKEIAKFCRAETEDAARKTCLAQATPAIISARCLPSRRATTRQIGAPARAPTKNRISIRPAIPRSIPRTASKKKNSSSPDTERAVLGYSCYAALTHTDDPAAHITSVASTIAIASGYVSRNAGRPKFVAVQLLTFCVPGLVAGSVNVVLGLAIGGAMPGIGPVAAAGAVEVAIADTIGVARPDEVARLAATVANHRLAGGGRQWIDRGKR
eukprot:gene35170-47254_t